jgi:dynein assembly factor with WDR repeat domains 1
MKLKRFLLRYYPPGIILEYEQGGRTLSKCVDLLDLRPESDVAALVQEICSREPLVTPRKAEQLAALIRSGLAAVSLSSVSTLPPFPLPLYLSLPFLSLSLAELQGKLGEPQEKQFQLFKVLRTHILPVTNVAINKSGSW